MRKGYQNPNHCVEENPFSSFLRFLISFFLSNSLGMILNPTLNHISTDGLVKAFRVGKKTYSASNKAMPGPWVWKDKADWFSVTHLKMLTISLAWAPWPQSHLVCQLRKRCGAICLDGHSDWLSLPCVCKSACEPVDMGGKEDTMMTHTPLGTGVICSMSLPVLDCYSIQKMHDK